MRLAVAAQKEIAQDINRRSYDLYVGHGSKPSAVNVSSAIISPGLQFQLGMTSGL